jgi:hypothetical protein
MKLKFKLPLTRNGRIAAVVVLLVLVALVARTCGSAAESGGDPAHGYLGKIHIRGYEKVRDLDDAPNATAIFVGDPGPDVPEAVSGPDLKMRTPAKETSDGPLTLVATGTAAMTKGSDCDVRVYRYHKGTPPAQWKLASGLAAQVKSGKQQALQVEVGCPFSA